MQRLTKKLSPQILIVYYILFLALWTLRNILLRDTGALNVWVYDSISAVIKLALWVVPCIFLVKSYEKDLVVTLRGLFTNRVNWVRTLPYFAFCGLYVLVGSYLFTGKIGISPKFTPHLLIGGFLVVGITEEMVFRGWLLNAMLTWMKPAWAIGLNALLFLVIHFPGWIMQGVFVSNITHFGFVAILVMSVVFSYAFYKSKNLMVPVVLHMFYDVMTLVFFSL